MKSIDSKLYGLFGLCNIVLALLVGIVWIAPTLSSLTRVRETIRLQENRLAAYRRIQSAHGEDSLYERANAGVRLFPYVNLADALTEMTETAFSLGLRETSLTAAEPTIYDDDGRGDNRVLFEMRVSAAYEGDAEALLAFAYGLGEVHVRNLQILFDGDAAVMRVIFSLYAAYD